MKDPVDELMLPEKPSSVDRVDPLWTQCRTTVKSGSMPDITVTTHVPVASTSARAAPEPRATVAATQHATAMQLRKRIAIPCWRYDSWSTRLATRATFPSVTDALTRFLLWFSVRGTSYWNSERSIASAIISAPSSDG